MISDGPDPTEKRYNFTRRDFVKATAAVSAVSVIPTIPTWAYAGGSDQIRIGFIGCGGRGSGAAGQALRADSGAVLWAMGDAFQDRLDGSLGNLKKASDIADRIDVPTERRFVGFDAYQHVMDSDVDLVILTTPPGFRPMHLKAAVDAGKHVFLEKPMAVDATGVRSVLDSCRRAEKQNLKVCSGFCWRASYPQRAAYSRILDGQIGDITSMHTTYYAGTLGQKKRKPEWSDMEWQMRNWWHFTWLSGDHIVEQACHSIDWINWAKNGEMPVSVTALGGRQAREGAGSGNAYDHFAVIYEYADGTRCFHTSRQMDNCPSDNTSYVTGTKGTCAINPWTPSCVIEGENSWRYEGDNPNMYQVEHNELFASIRNNKPMNHGQWMCNSTMMAIIGRMSAYTGQTISWDEAFYSPHDLSPAAYEFGDLTVAPVAIPGRTKLVRGSRPTETATKIGG